jgi:filamentous hemagglutinin family protein
MTSTQASSRLESGLHLRPLALALLSLGMAPALAQIAPNTLPTGFAGVAGGLSVNSSPGVMNILQTTPRAIAQWQSFSIGSSSTVNVAQPGITSVLLSRVVGPDPSIIAGSLNANGHVYLVNPSGVLFAKGSSVNVGGLVASTLAIADDNFMAGGRLVFERAAGSPASVINAGTITATRGGTVTLMGESVRNDGTITVPQGTIGLVSARKVIVDFNGDGLTTFTIPADSMATTALVANTGTLAADGGRVSMQAAATAVAQVVNQGGIVRARSISGHPGQIVLSASGSDSSEIVLGGSIDASGRSDLPGVADAAGGSVTAQAALLRLDGATVDAGGSQGGSIALTGTNGLAMSPTAAVRADGSAGSGGSMTLGAPNGLVHVSGQLSAQGTGSGSGGQILTKGLSVEAGADADINAAGGPGGANGTWSVASSLDLTVTGNEVPYEPGAYASNGISLINAAALGRTLGRATDVVLGSEAMAVPGRSPGLGVSFDPGASVSKAAGRDASLTVNSASNIAMGAGSAIQSTAGALNVAFNADAGGAPVPGGSIAMQSATIETHGGNISFYGQSDPVNGRAVGGASPAGPGADGIAINGSVLSTCTAGQASCALAGNISLSGQGGLGGAGVHATGSDISAGGDVRISGTTTVAASNGVTLANTNVTAGAGHQISVLGKGPAYGVSIGASPGQGLLKASGGRITIDGQGSDVMLSYAGSEGNPISDSMLDVASPSAAGGSVAVSGRNIGVIATGGQAAQFIDASGAGSGGSIAMRATADPAIGNSGIIAIGSNIGMRADANSAVGHGGSIRLLADTSLSDHGSLTARGGASGGDGGYIETSGHTVSLAGIRVDASAPAGAAGTWLIDPFIVDIQHGAQVEGPPLDVSLVSATANSTVLDGDINFTLNSGSNVRITTTGATATTGAGSVNFDTGVVISLTRPALAPAATFQIDATGDITTAPLFGGAYVAPTITSTTAPLNVVFNAGLPFAGSAGVGSVNFSGTITTAGGALTATAGGVSGDGSIFWQGAIQTGGGAVNMAAGGTSGGGQGSISMSGNVTTSGGSVALSAGGATGSGHGTVDVFGQILTGGGNVTMSARSTDADETTCAVCVFGTVDTRVGQSDSGIGGSVRITGNATGQFGADGVEIGSQILSSTGDVTVTGTAQAGSGVNLSLSEAGPNAGITSTSGNISLTGIGSPATFSSTSSPGDGITIDLATLQSTDGNIAVHGLSQRATTSAMGVDLRDGAVVTTLGAGDIDISGQSTGNAAGVYLSPFIAGSGPGSPVFIPTQAASSISGKRNVVLRASNDGTTDAIVIGGTVRAGNVLDLRPGGVDATTGNAVDHTADPITLGGTASQGFAISAAEFGQLTAASLVFGSNTEAGLIELVAPLTSAVPLVLESGGGGGIKLDAPVTAPQLGLISGGDITQAAGATITAGELLARSSGGNVILTEPTNSVSVNTLGGGAAGLFEYVNSGALTIGPVSITGYDATGNLPQTVTSTSLSAGTVLVRTLSGDLGLAGNVNSTTSTDLVAAGRFQNIGGAGSITGAPWRIWASTWVGETRGNVAGSGPLPNLYACAYLGLCAVTVSPGDNHFIYAQQPSATVVIGNFVRPFGTPNPVFTYSITGLILGDRGTGFSGTTGTTATIFSRAGLYPVFGTFTSAEGYKVTVLPGTLQVFDPVPLVVSAAQQAVPDVVRDPPTTWLYERNIGKAPICRPTGDFEENKPQQAADVLGREWSRVRLRPNLMSCVDTERRNGCADF